MGLEAFSWEGEVGKLEGAVGDWRPDLVNKSAENTSVDFNIQTFLCTPTPPPLKIPFHQKNSRRLWAVSGGLFGGSRGKLQESPWAGCWKKLSRIAKCKQMLGFRAPGKANLPKTLCPPCPGPAGCFFEIDCSSLTKFF